MREDDFLVSLFVAGTIEEENAQGVLSIPPIHRTGNIGYKGVLSILSSYLQTFTLRKSNSSRFFAVACVSHHKSVFHKGYQSRGMVDCERNTQNHSKWVSDHTCISGLGSNVFGVFLLQ